MEGAMPEAEAPSIMSSKKQEKILNIMIVYS